MHDEWESVIQEILDEFNFSRVREIMKVLNWTWEQDGINCIPKKKQLKTKAKVLMYEALKYMSTQDEIYIATGGFVVEAWITKEQLNMSLSFKLDSWEASKERLNKL